MANGRANSEYYARFVQLTNHGKVLNDNMEHTVDLGLTGKEIQDRAAWRDTLISLRAHYHTLTNRINTAVVNPEMVLNQRLAAPNLTRHRKQASPRSSRTEERRRNYPRRIESWSMFRRSASQYRLTQQQNDFEVDVNESGVIFSNSIMAPGERAVDEGGEKQWLVNRLNGSLECAGLVAMDENAAGALGRPDFALHRFNINGDLHDQDVDRATRTIMCEVKSTQNLCLPVAAHRTAKVYNDESRALEENGVQSTEWANVCCPLGQLFCYMIENRRRHGALTSDTRTYFCSIQVNNGNVKFLVSDAWLVGEANYLRAWAYLQKLACDDLDENFDEKDGVWESVVSSIRDTTPYKRSTRSSRKRDSLPFATRRSKRLCCGGRSGRTDASKTRACHPFCVVSFALDGMVPIVSYRDVKILDVIGHGTNGAAFKAHWCGQDVALKQFDLEKGGMQAFQTEVSAYAKLRHFWGELVPSPLFVCESVTGCLVFLGLQLGRPFAEGDDMARMFHLAKTIREHGIKLLDVRMSNFVFLPSEDGPERLVAIDLEDHVLDFDSN